MNLALLPLCKMVEFCGKTCGHKVGALNVAIKYCLSWILEKLISSLLLFPKLSDELATQPEINGFQSPLTQQPLALWWQASHVMHPPC